jgi:hypothetical protein
MGPAGLLAVQKQRVQQGLGRYGMWLAAASPVGGPSGRKVWWVTDGE